MRLSTTIVASSLFPNFETESGANPVDTGIV